MSLLDNVHIRRKIRHAVERFLPNPKDGYHAIEHELARTPNWPPVSAASLHGNEHRRHRDERFLSESKDTDSILHEYSDEASESTSLRQSWSESVPPSQRRLPSESSDGVVTSGIGLGRLDCSGGDAHTGLGGLDYSGDDARNGLGEIDCSGDNANWSGSIETRVRANEMDTHTRPIKEINTGHLDDQMPISLFADTAIS
jgi:hypothetical protein